MSGNIGYGCALYEDGPWSGPYPTLAVAEQEGKHMAAGADQWEFYVCRCRPVTLAEVAPEFLAEAITEPAQDNLEDLIGDASEDAKWPVVEIQQAIAAVIERLSREHDLGVWAPVSIEHVEFADADGEVLR